MILQLPTLPANRVNERAFIPATGGQPLLRWIGLDVATQRFYLDSYAGVEMTDFLPHSQKVLWQGFDVERANLEAGGHVADPHNDGTFDEVIYDTVSGSFASVSEVTANVGSHVLQLPAQMVRVSRDIAEGMGAVADTSGNIARSVASAASAVKAASLPVSMILFPVALWIGWKLFFTKRSAAPPNRQLKTA